MFDDFDFDKIKAASIAKQEAERQRAEADQAKASREMYLKRETNDRAATELAGMFGEVLRDKILQGSYSLGIVVEEDSGDGAAVKVMTRGQTCLEYIRCVDGVYIPRSGGEMTDAKALVIKVATALAEMTPQSVQTAMEFAKKGR